MSKQSLINDLCCMQLLYAQATEPSLRAMTNSLYPELQSKPEARKKLRDSYYIPNSKVPIRSTEVTMSKDYADNLVQISGAPAANILVNQTLGEVAYRCAFSKDRQAPFVLAAGESVPAGAPTLDEQQQQSLVLILWRLAFDDDKRQSVNNAKDKNEKSGALLDIEVDGQSLNQDTCDWLAGQLVDAKIVDIKNFLGFYLYKATW